MASRLGVYWSVMHRRPQDYDYFKRLQPSVFKIMDGGPNDYQWARENLPNSLILARDWAMSEQHEDMLKNPHHTGQRHAEEWWQHSERLGFDRSKTLVLGINEPRVWVTGVTEALREYTIALCGRASQLGLRVGAMQLSVGWPNNTGPDTPPDWSPWHGVENAIKKGNHALVTHEYWADNGPSENWGWWAGRSLKCPWQVPLVIGECGVDMYVKDASIAHNQRGWHGRMHPNRYASELAEYAGRMSADSRFAGCCVFASDFANREWFSFDIEPAYQAILATPIPDGKPPVDTHLPSVISPGPTPVEPPKETSMSIIDPRVGQTLISVESSGEAFGPDGRVLIRFENHIFMGKLGNDALYARHFQHGSPVWTGHKWRRSEADPWWEVHTGNQASEYAAFEFAMSLNRDAAFQSISMGLGQIMGFNARRVGFASAEAMYNAFRDEAMQVFGFMNFFLSDPELYQAVRQKEWRTIARLYNGPGNVDTVAPRLQKTYEALG